jgi:ubiquinone/menaquinone biosynthesis C-methylase UbiE
VTRHRSRPTVTDLAERYERQQVPALYGPWARDLLDAAGLRPGDRVLDVAWGTGIVARGAADRVVPECEAA